MSPHNLLSSRRLTLVEAHATLGQILDLRHRAAALDDGALVQEIKRLSALSVEHPGKPQEEHILWEAVLRSERARRARWVEASIAE